MLGTEASLGLSRALVQGALCDEDAACCIYDLDALDSRLAELHTQFPASALHAVAVKAAPLPALLARLVRQGAGLEAASLPELRLALASGCPPERMVFDSPCKTLVELRLALDLGVTVNIDNFQELDRVRDLLAGHAPKGGIGLRVNPQVGLGSIAATSVAGEYSKFGVPIQARREIVQAFSENPWLTGLHLHVGSQGCPMDMLVRACRIALDLRRDIHAVAGEARISRMDIGGGLPVSYGREERPEEVANAAREHKPDSGAERVRGPLRAVPAMDDYAQALRRKCPELFAPDVRLVTEFGRWMFANAGFAASRVEYVKQQPGHRTAVIHLGADMFLRTCYVPETWHHELRAAHPDGSLKEGPKHLWHVAGPLCFSGDFLARDRLLPDVVQGDWIIILDAGAYTLGMWSRYNSRQMPIVLGLERGVARVLKPRESVEQVMEFWG